MRIHHVTIEGFGPFKQKQNVAFDQFADDGLFLIAGPTGAGKSSILDAIVFALYGTTPRYEAEDRLFRSDFSEIGEPTRVQVEMTTNGTRYRITRTAEYPRETQRGKGITTAKAEVELEQLTDNGWLGVATQQRVVAAKLQEIIGLNANQFLQVMLLAQNRFSEFLLADTKDRRDLLRKLFGAERFEWYETYLDELRKEKDLETKGAAQSLAAFTSQLEHLTASTWDPETSRAAWLESLSQSEAALLAAVRKRHDAAAQLFAERQKQLAVAQATAALQKRRNSANELLRQVSENRQLAESWDQRLADHQRAATLIPSIRNWRAAENAVVLATEQANSALTAAAKIDPKALTPAQAELLAEGKIAQIPAHEVALIRDGVLAQVAKVEPLAAEEERLVELEKRATAAEQEHQRVTLARKSALQQIADLKTQLATDQNRSQELAPQAALVEACAAQVESAQVVQVAAAALPEAQEQLVAAEAAAATQAEAQQAAAGEVTRLWAARLASSVAEIAAKLKPDQPCPVCGSCEHPNPALPPEQPVSDEMIDDAQAEVERQARLVTKALGVVDRAKQNLTELITQAKGLTAEQAEADLSADRANLTEAKAAAQELKTLTATITQGQAKMTELSNEAEDALGELQELANSSSTAKANLEAARTRVQQAIGEWGSIANQLQALKTAETLLATLATALRSLSSAQQNAVTAQGSLDQALAEQDFASVAAAELALLPEAEFLTLSQQLAEHRNNEAVAKATLAEPEMQGLPAELIDLAPLETATRDAEEQNREVTAELGAIRERQKTVTALTADVTALIESSEAATAELAVIRRLAESLRGNPPNDRKMRLIDFVLAAELEQIVLAANARLAEMSIRRYSFEHTDERAKGGRQSGLGLRIIDAHTGKARPTESLSGGERFLASLALALGLAETVSNRAGGIKLDTLFIDEGFGSLDPETLETAMATLDSLRANGRTVGVISHVEVMHERIPAQISVHVGKDRDSHITQ